MAAPLVAVPENFYYDYSAEDHMEWSDIPVDLFLANDQETYAHQEDREWMNHLPIGMRFCPTDQELIESYLKLRVLGYHLPATGIINEVNIYDHEPQALKDFAYCHDDGRMYFFTPLKRKDNSKTKSERLVDGGRLGFWKATQKRANILDKNGVIIGTRASLTYNTSTVNKDTGTRRVKKEDWLMAEYRLPEKFYQTLTELDNKEEVVLCVIYLTQRGRTIEK